MRPRVARLGPALLLRLYLRRRRNRHVVIAVVGNGDQPRGAVGRNEQRLGARAEHAVPALQLRAIDGQVSLVNELLRIGTVLRIASDANRDGGTDRLARRLDVERTLRHPAAEPVGNLERLLRRRLRKQDRELLAAEARGDVVVAELRAED